VYVVKRGDTIFNIAARYGITVNDILNENRFINVYNIQVGDRIVSSGYGSVYPRGLVIGTVEKIEKDSASRSVTVTVRPGADLSDLKKMMIITDYEVYTEQSE